MASAQEQMAWSHPPGSDLVVWANALQSSPIVVSELGDSPSAFGNPDFRRLIGNALRWTASDQAREWASAFSGQAPAD
jgi:type 1 glutamine amidotransferase